MFYLLQSGLTVLSSVAIFHCFCFVSVFFFSSRRRHTRSDRDWSSDVCSSDLNPLALELLTKEWVAHGSSSLLSDIEALNTQPVANIGIPRAIGAVFDRQIRRLEIGRASCRERV